MVASSRSYGGDKGWLEAVRNKFVFRYSFAVVLGTLIAALAPGLAWASNGHSKAYVEPSLLKKAQDSPNALVRVIIQARSATLAQTAFLTQAGLLDGDKLGRRLGAVHGTAAVMKAKRIARMADQQDLIITPGPPVAPSDFSSDQLWPLEPAMRSSGAD